MQMLKSSLRFMKSNNAENQYENAITKQSSMLKFMMTDPGYRQELPDEEETPLAA